MTPDGSRLPVDDRSGKRLPLTAGSSRRPHGPRDRRHRRRSSARRRSVGPVRVHSLQHTLLVPCLAAWRRTRCTAPPPGRGCSRSPGPPDQPRPPVNQGPGDRLARVTRRAHPSSGGAGSANPATLTRPAPHQSPLLASESVNLSPGLKGRYTTHCLGAQSCAAAPDSVFFAPAASFQSRPRFPGPPPFQPHLRTITLLRSIDIPLLLAPTYFRPQFGEDFIPEAGAVQQSSVEHPPLGASAAQY